MNIYEKYILPKVIHQVCSLKPMMRQREKVVPLAKGQVLEIGIGSGLNLKYYDPRKVKGLIGADPTPEKKALAKNSAKCDFQIEVLFSSAEKLDLPNNSIDTVVSTYTFCTIPDVISSIQELHRVLKPSGQLLFVEHGKAPDIKVQRMQNRINPIWKRLAGGCHLNRDIQDLLFNHGFSGDHLETMYLPGWKPATYNIWGVLKPK